MAKNDLIDKLFGSETGVIIISILLGIGLATVFRKECLNNNCVVIQGPNPNEITKYFHKMNEKCYKYTPEMVDCNKK